MQIIQTYFPALNPRQVSQFMQLEPLYQDWNQRINVISRKDIDSLYEHHILHSLAISKFISFNPGTTVIDAGTGGGLPGIPLSILFPDVSFILVDSITKKTKVAEAIIHETGLTNCTVRNLRLEDMKDKADFVVCRAVTQIPKLFGWVKKNIIPGGTHSVKNGLLALKGGDLEEEIMNMGFGIKIFNLSDYFPEPYFETKKLVYVPR